MRNRSWLLLVAVLSAALWSAGVWAVDRSNASGTLTTNEMIFKSAELGRLNVFNRADTDRKLGHLSDLIVDSRTGRVLYGILDTGIGGKYVIVPWNALQLQEDIANRKSSLALNKTNDELKNAPSFDMKTLPDFTSAEWQGSVDRFFGVRTVARPVE